MKLIEAMNEINNAKGINFSGKKYTVVSNRVEIFRKSFGIELGIKTEIILNDGKFVIVKAIIEDKDGHVVGSGFAEEVRGSSNVNKTSALENCETSAIGRALASLGLHGGTYASLNEIDAVKRKEKALEEKALEETALEETALKEKKQQKLIDYEARVLNEFNKITHDRQFSERDRMTNLKDFKTQLSNLNTMPKTIQEIIDNKYKQNLAWLGVQMGKNNGNMGSNTETS